MRSADRGEKKGNLRPDKNPSRKRSDVPFRARNSNPDRSRSRQHEARRHRKVRFKGVPEDDSIDGSVTSQTENLGPSTDR